MTVEVDTYYQRRVSSSGSVFAAGPASRMDDAYHMRLPKWVPREHYSRLRYADHMPQCSHPLHCYLCTTDLRVCLTWQLRQEGLSKVCSDTDYRVKTARESCRSLSVMRKVNEVWDVPMACRIAMWAEHCSVLPQVYGAGRVRQHGELGEGACAARRDEQPWAGAASQRAHRVHRGVTSEEQ